MASIVASSLYAGTIAVRSAATGGTGRFGIVGAPRTLTFLDQRAGKPKVGRERTPTFRLIRR